MLRKDEMVAIILVNYNGAMDTIDCIKSLSAIKDIEYELIVVDNKSTDDSVHKLKKFQSFLNFTLIEANCNNGFSAGNNLGILYAPNADYYLLLNNDTVVKPNFLAELLSEIQKHPQCGATTPKILYYSNPDMIWYAGGSFNRKTARSEHYRFSHKNTDQKEQPQNVTFASGCCLCISRKVFETIGVLNEDFFLYEEDAEFCYRIIEAGFNIVYVPNSIIYHKISSSTGQGSPMSQYYTVRNKYLLIRMHFNGINKVCAYLYCTAQFLFRCIKKEQSFKYFKSGINAFLRHETGKAQGDIE